MLKKIILTLIILSPSTVFCENNPFSFNDCIKEGISRKECEIMSCATHPKLNYAKCKCIRECALNVIECIKREKKSGISENIIRENCNLAKNICAKKCIKNR